MGEKRKLAEMSSRKEDDDVIMKDSEELKSRVTKRYTSASPPDVDGMIADLAGILSHNFELARGLNQLRKQDDDDDAITMLGGLKGILSHNHGLSQELRQLCLRVEAFNC